MRISLLALGVLVAVAGCGGEGDPLGEAAARMDGQSARMQVEMRLDGGDQESVTRARALMSADGTRSQVNAELQDADGATLFTIVTVDRDAWMGGPDLESELPDGKRWVHNTELAGQTSTLTMGEIGAVLTRTEQVKSAGEETVRDQPATHYRGRIAPRAYAEALGDETPTGTGELHVPVDVWIDERGRPLRLITQTKADEGLMTITTDVLAYGVPADIQPPAPGETIERAEYDALAAG